MENLTIATVEEKLRTLYTLQLIFFQLFNIKKQQGYLPHEIKALEEEIEQKEREIKDIEGEISILHFEINENKNFINEAEKAVNKYKIQLNDVKNHKEYEALIKESDIEMLKMENFEKKRLGLIKKVEHKKVLKENLDDTFAKKMNQLDEKKNSLSSIVQKNKEIENLWVEQKEKYSSVLKKLDKKLLSKLNRFYEKLEHSREENSKNILEYSHLVAPLDRSSSTSSYIMIPTQVYLDVALRLEIIHDEHSGSILIDGNLAEEVEKEVEKIEKKIRDKLNKAS